MKNPNQDNEKMEPQTTFLTVPSVLEIIPLFLCVYVCVHVCVCVWQRVFH